VRASYFRGVAVVILSWGAWGQGHPAFEVASIKRNLSTGTNTQIQVSGGRLTVTNGSAKTLIRNAYGILSFQLANEPRWLDGEMYDIVAVSGRREEISPDGLKAMLRQLLADRFKLKTHWETRETSVYALVVAKDGPKFQESAPAREPSINTRKEPNRVLMKGGNEPISILASNLGNQLGRIVLDQTGLAGVYDWVLEWDPDPTTASTRPSLFDALREQLGLRLEAQKGPMETLVIDRVERPSEN